MSTGADTTGVEGIDVLATDPEQDSEAAMLTAAHSDGMSLAQDHTWPITTSNLVSSYRAPTRTGSRR